MDSRRLLRGAPHIGRLIPLGLLVACLDHGVGITEPGQAGFAVIVSRPLPVNTLTTAQRALPFADAAAGGDSVVYVSLSPGTTPGGATIAIRNVATGASQTAPLLNGGLDPIAVLAQTGDTLEFVVTDSAGHTRGPETSVATVHPLVVVRTDPPTGGTDVAINAQIVVVFSEPMDPLTITTQTIQLHASGGFVSGNVALTPDGLRAVFTPAAPLAPLTTYTVTISSDVASVGADPLASPLLITFQTGMIFSGAPLGLGSVSAGDQHTCAVTESGDAFCWGANEYGELGGGFVSPYVASPVAVSGGLKFAWIGAGSGFTCGLIVTGSAYCWGANQWGQLGSGDTTARLSPFAVSGGFTFATLSVGTDHSCGVTIDGRGLCWGSGWVGELGGGAPVLRGQFPELVDPGHVPLGFSPSIAATGLDHSCGLDISSHAFCWGATTYLARNDTLWIMDWSPWPLPVSASLTLKSVATGLLHACGIGTDGAAYCWGTNSGGELGDGTTADRTVPVAVAGGLKFEQLLAGQGQYTCGLVAGGAMYCWGLNGSGELGTSAILGICPGIPTPFEPDSGPGYRLDLPCSTVPIRAGGALTFASVGAGSFHACGVTLTGSLYCWGANTHGQLGDGTTTQSSSPVLVPLQLVPAASRGHP